MSAYNMTSGNGIELNMDYQQIKKWYRNVSSLSAMQIEIPLMRIMIPMGLLIAIYPKNYAIAWANWIVVSESKFFIFVAIRNEPFGDHDDIIRNLVQIR